MKVLTVILASLLLALPPAALAAAQEAPLDVRLLSGTQLEERGRQQLLKILETYPLEKWIFTRTVTSLRWRPSSMSRCTGTSPIAFRRK